MGLSQLVQRTLPEATLRFVHIKPLPQLTWHYICRDCDADSTALSTTPLPIICDACGGTARAQVCLTCAGPGCEFDDECPACFARRILSGEHQYADMVLIFGQEAVDAALAGSTVSA